MIIIHGASNWGSSNFGDFIYIDKLAKHISKQLGTRVRLAEPSNYFCELMPFAVQDNVDYRDCELFIYAPGGYFGEGHSASKKSSLVQFVRFIPAGLRAIKHRIPIAVVGVGAGPNQNKLLSWGIRKIVESSILTTVRDHESFLALSALGIKNAVETADMILAMDLGIEVKQTDQLESIELATRNHKIMVVHYNHSVVARDLFATSVALFIDRHPEYRVIVCYDQLLESHEAMWREFQRSNPEALLFDYHNPYELVGLLARADCVLTCKLHVGVVAAMFGKSVICSAEHPEKTKRFYRQIGCPERCVSLYDCNQALLENLLEKWHNKGTEIPGEVTAAARLNWDYLDKILDNIILKNRYQ